jgi:hypothetical protein
VTDDYLWDRRGTPDPDVEALERQLAMLRSSPPPPDWSHVSVPTSSWRGAVWLAAAASVVLALTLSLWFARPRGSWTVTALAGEPTVSTRTMRGTERLEVGDWLETDARSRARLDVGAIGRVDVEPDTRVRLVNVARDDHRLSLARGTMHAFIWAPPGQFVVETPSSVAVDLGCAYTLQVAPDGSGVIDVTAGWVGFEWNGRESFIPADARCATRRGVGPGTPYYNDVSEAFRIALAAIDFEHAPDVKRAALARVIASARPRDALTLWHLLSRVSVQDRAAVFDQLAELVQPPPGVTRDGILAGDRAMRERWWDALGLGDTSWWKYWKVQRSKGPTS